MRLNLDGGFGENFILSFSVGQLVGGSENGGVIVPATRNSNQLPRDDVAREVFQCAEELTRIHQLPRPRA